MSNNSFSTGISLKINKIIFNSVNTIILGKIYNLKDEKKVINELWTKLSVEVYKNVYFEVREKHYIEQKIKVIF